jgi:hypothetical protein
VATRRRALDLNRIPVPGPDGDISAERVHLKPLAALCGYGGVDLLGGGQSKSSGQGE